MLGFQPIASAPISALSARTSLVAAAPTLPLLTMATTVKPIAKVNGNTTLPLLAIATQSAYFVQAAQTLPLLTLSASAQQAVSVHGAIQMPALGLAARAINAALVKQNVTLPAMQLSATAIAYWNLPGCGWIDTVGDAVDAFMRHLPQGMAWLAWRWPGKTAFKLTTAIGNFFEEAKNALCNVVKELDPRTTTDMIDEWETALSLPDKCLPVAVTLEERRRNIWFRLQKRRWSSAEDWKQLAAMFGLRIDVTPGWLVQKPALYDACYPKRYDLFPKLGRFRVYVDVTNVKFPGYDYGDEDGGPGYPIPYGFTDETVSAFMCLIDRVRPAHVIVLWNEYPTKLPCVIERPLPPAIDFSKPLDSEYIPLI